MTTPCKVPCSPAMREFNDAVEAADNWLVLDSRGTLEDLVTSMWNYNLKEPAFRILLAREKLSAQERAQFQ